MRRCCVSSGRFRSASTRRSRSRSWDWQSMSLASSCSVAGNATIITATNTVIPATIGTRMHIVGRTATTTCEPPSFTADAAVSGLVVVGLLLGRFLGWIWMDPVAGLWGGIVIAAWSYGLVRDTGAILLDMTPDRGMADRMRDMVEADGDQLTDLHLWRLGPGHLAAILSIVTQKQRGPEYYRSLLSGFSALS